MTVDAKYGAEDNRSSRSRSDHANDDILRDSSGRPLKLGPMQKWIIEVLSESPSTIEEVATRLKEDPAVARTRLKQLASRGAVELGVDQRWRNREGLVIPAAEPHARKRKMSKAAS